MLNFAVVIPCFHGRENNLHMVLDSLEAQTSTIQKVLIVDDGGDLQFKDGERNCVVVRTEKHHPGMEQPRNIGVREASSLWPDTTHVWFVDSDVMMAPETFAEIQKAYSSGSPNRIMICPYEWLPDNVKPESNLEDFFRVAREVKTDFRLPGFQEHDPTEEIIADISCGLACFSGNLVWPVEEFKRVGGFWNQIHHGRCEDGELGIRAVAMGVPISWCATARGFHLSHPINNALQLERNMRDVPMLNDRHPWVEGSGIFMVDRDGKAFDCLCPKCGESVNTILWWNHAESCGISSTIAIKPA
jgi:GT2 family glycosyltransferase